MHNAVIRFFFFSCLCFFSNLLTGQQQMGPYIAYGPEAKYFSNLNYSVYQSKNGYLWFGTSSGVVRFDGKRYKNFFANFTDSNSTSDNIIFDITEDKNSDLWFAGFAHGATRYDQRTGEFKKYPALTKDANPYYGIHRIVSDADKNLWFATAGRGLARYDFEKDSFLLYYPHPGMPRDGTARGFNYVTDIVQDKNDRNILWVGTFFGLFSFDKTTTQFTYYSSGQNKTSPDDILINDIEPDKNGLLWIGTYQTSLHCFDTKTKAFLPQYTNKFAPIVYDLKFINDTVLYAACLDDGLYQVNIKTGIASNISPPFNPSDPTTKHAGIQKVSVTPEAGVFIGGNYYFYQLHPNFLRLKKNVFLPLSKNGPASVILSGIVWDEKRQVYWITTVYEQNGVYVLDKDLRGIKQVSFKQKTNASNINFKKPVVDALGRVWISNNSNTIYQWDDREELFVETLGLPVTAPLTEKPGKLTATKEGNLWMMSGDRFIYYNVIKNITESYPIAWSNQYKGRHDIAVSELKADPDGNAWLFTENGMFFCNRDTKKVEHIFSTRTGKNDLRSSIVRSGAFNKYNDLWITSGNGIQVISRKDHSVLANHTVDVGLPSMLVSSINTDSSGRIWAGTTAGLGLFNPKNKTWRVYNRLDGLERDYLDGDISITSNNKIVIDQVNGFLIKDVNELAPDSKPPVLHITSIRINGMERRDSLLPEFTHGLVLPYDQNNIDIEFAAMDWLYPFKTFYYFRIDGISTGKGMSDERQDGKISMVGLQPGKYVLHIKALSGNGIYSEEMVFPVIIKPPYWKTWWFISICALLLASLLYGLYRYRINRIIEMQNLRNNISKDLHDDIGASLSNINILNELTRRNIEQPEKSKEYLAKASEDIQRISESLSDIVWNINPKYDDPENLFIRMKRYVADMLDGKNINGDLDFPDNAAKFSLSMTKRRDLYLIFKEAVNNLIKYSGAKNAVIKVNVTEHHISLLIKDDGKGFDREKIRMGNGLQNMEQRAKAAGAILTVASVPGKGTTVELIMKVG